MLSSSLFRSVRPALRQVRKLSGHSGEEAKSEAQRWFKFSIVMCGISTAVAVYNLFGEHEHAGKQGLSYQKLRNKPYPWRECPDCNLLDGNCWKECRGEEVSHHH